MLSGSDVPAAPLSSGGEGRELHRAPPIREQDCSGAPRRALRVNKLYPEILSPLLPSPVRFSPISLTSSFIICFLVFFFPSCCFVSFGLFITVTFLGPPSHAPLLPLSPSYPQQPVKTSCHWVCQQRCSSVRRLQLYGNHSKFTCQTLLLYASLIQNCHTTAVLCWEEFNFRWVFS